MKSSSPSPSGSSRPSSVKSAPSRFSSPFFSRLPTSPSSKAKGQTSPAKSSTSNASSKDSKGKESKSKGVKSPSSSKKDSKLPVTSSGAKSSGLPVPSGRGTDSDSGNDSGIVKSDKKSKRLLSPYSTVTNPRVSTHSSSGHGSDFSTSSAQRVLENNTKLIQHKEAAHLSSGYESMVGQDGEVTGTSSSTQDSTSESSAGGRIPGNKVLKKKPPTSKGW